MEKGAILTGDLSAEPRRNCEADAMRLRRIPDTEGATPLLLKERFR
jgi:hypothetical protein